MDGSVTSIFRVLQRHRRNSGEELGRYGMNWDGGLLWEAQCDEGKRMVWFWRPGWFSFYTRSEEAEGSDQVDHGEVATGG